MLTEPSPNVSSGPPVSRTDRFTDPVAAMPFAPGRFTLLCCVRGTDL